MDKQWEKLVAELQKIIDGLRSGKADDADLPSDLPAYCAPFLRTVLAVVCAEQTPSGDALLRLKDVTVTLVNLLVQELQANRNIWSTHKRAAQEALNTQLFECLMGLRPPLVDMDKAEVLADRLLQQARANHDTLMQVQGHGCVHSGR